MTCKCPRWMCYYRADCRRNERREALARAAGVNEHHLWLIERHEALLAELEQPFLTAKQRRSKEAALAVILAAIERRMRGEDVRFAENALTR